MKEAGRLAGYKSNDIYRKRIKSHIKKVLDVDRASLFNRFQDVYNQCIDRKDYTNALRASENIARMQGEYLDRSQVDHKNPDKIAICYINKPNVNVQSKDSLDITDKNKT